MAVCEKCWADANRRAYSSHRSVTECYKEILEERKDNPCTEEEQRGGLNERQRKS